MGENKNVAIRKRQQIQSASRTMFIWVAAAAAIVGIAVVLSISLFERLSFNQKVIAHKQDTASTLEQNNQIVDELKRNVRVLNTNEALNETPRLEGTEPLSVVLDALPSTANSSALGASLQQKLLRQSGVTIEMLTVFPIAGVEDDDEQGSVDEDEAENEIRFQFVVSAAAGQDQNLKRVLLNLQDSIRAIDIDTVTVEQQSRRIIMNVEGKAFYQPEKQVELKEVSKKPRNLR